MKIKKYVIISLFLSYFSISASVIKPIEKKIRLNLTGTQSTINDWQQGNVNSLETLLGLDYQQIINIDTFRLRSRITISYGTIYKKDDKLLTETFLPTENKFSGEAVLSYPIGWKIDPFISASFQTQISESFKLVKDNKLRTAKFWDPVVAQQSLGFEFLYSLNKNNITSNLGISIKQIRAYYHTTQTDNPKTTDIKERYFTDAGIRWKTDINCQFTDNINYRSSIDLFASYSDFTKWSTKFNNDIKITLYKQFAILLTINCNYDEKQALFLQYKQMMSIGIVADIN